MDGELFGFGNRLSERKRGRNFTKGAFGEFSLSRLVASLPFHPLRRGWLGDGWGLRARAVSRTVTAKNGQTDYEQFADKRGKGVPACEDFFRGLFRLLRRAASESAASFAKKPSAPLRCSPRLPGPFVSVRLARETSIR